MLAEMIFNYCQMYRKQIECSHETNAPWEFALQKEPAALTNVDLCAYLCICYYRCIQKIHHSTDTVFACILLETP